MRSGIGRVSRGEVAMTALTVARRNNPDDGWMPGFGMDGCRS